MLPLAGFWLLVAATLVRPGGAVLYRDKAWRDWLLDLTGLAIQGGLIPLLEVLLVAGMWRATAPSWAARLELPGADEWVGFVLAFAGVDYLYYWNHRLLHKRRLWRLHLVHHTVTQMDVVSTSRNTLWTSFLLVYLWVHGSMLYLLAEPSGYAAGVAVTAVLDLWRHSSVDLPRWLSRAFDGWLVQPRDHAVHHGRRGCEGNYGANLLLWDRLHGTRTAGNGDGELGVVTEMGLVRQMFWPEAS